MELGKPLIEDTKGIIASSEGEEAILHVGSKKYTMPELLKELEDLTPFGLEQIDSYIAGEKFLRSIEAPKPDTFWKRKGIAVLVTALISIFVLGWIFMHFW